MEPCKFFAKGGHCTRGSSCRYAHDQTEILEPCKYFAKGYCERGNDCFYPHIGTLVPGGKSHVLKGDAASFQPKLTTVINGTIGSSLVVCRFFGRGFCKNGENCRFEHSSDIYAGQSVHRERDSCSRNLSGAHVIFGPGAEVSCVNLHADFSAVQITGLTMNSPRLEILQLLLSDLGFSIPHNKFRLKGSKNGRVVVEVKVKDPAFAKNVISKFNEEVVKGNDQQIDIKQIHLASANGSLAVSKFRITSLLCSWRKATCKASLYYRDTNDAVDALVHLGTHGKIRGRKLRLSLVAVPYSSKYAIILQVENLDPLTKPIHFTSLLHGSEKPNDIVFGKPSHTKTDFEAEGIVKELLIEQGMQSWETNSSSDSSIGTAWATFESKDDGIRAMGNLHGTKIERSGNCELSLSHVISFTVSLPVLMLCVLETEVAKWKLEIAAKNPRIHVKSYPPAHGTSHYAVLRISGEDVKAVARAKSKLEVLLIGTLMETQESILWDPYFATVTGLECLQELQISNDVYIHRDLSKRRITVHGMNLRIAAVRKALYDKVQSISESNHTILLTPELLQRALSGGWQAISARLGKSSVIMNISQQPMSIKIKGSPADYQLALSLLRVNTTVEMTRKKSKETCVICWEEAVDPFSSPCYHTYCTECFVNQCNAAVDNDDFPIHCRGDEAKCLHIFTIPSLQNLVPSAVFEELLENSFKSYVQTHSRDFQYCPTPDCSQIYRITQSTTNSITSASFDCPNCLTSICISCASTCHDGITCADNKDIRAGYVQALNTFKAENDIRDCPTCKTPIEKVDGCNHLRCMGCKTHICWFCMCSLESAAACYAHMEEKHGGNGL